MLEVSVLSLCPYELTVVGAPVFPRPPSTPCPCLLSCLPPPPHPSQGSRRLLNANQIKFCQPSAAAIAPRIKSQFLRDPTILHGWVCWAGSDTVPYWGPGFSAKGAPFQGAWAGIFELGGGASDLECGELEGEAFRGGRARGAGLKQGCGPGTLLRAPRCYYR